MYLSRKDAYKVLMHFASFCNIMLNFGSHNDGRKLPSSLPHEWLAERKEQHIVEAQGKILLAQFLGTLVLKANVKLCCILQVSAIYYSTLAAIMMAVIFPIEEIFTFSTPKSGFKDVLNFVIFLNFLRRCLKISRHKAK